MKHPNFPQSFSEVFIILCGYTVLNCPLGHQVLDYDEGRSCWYSVTRVSLQHQFCRLSAGVVNVFYWCIELFRNSRKLINLVVVQIKYGISLE